MHSCSYKCKRSGCTQISSPTNWPIGIDFGGKKKWSGIFARDHQDCPPGKFEILNHFLYLKYVCVVIVSCTVYPVPVPRHHVSVVQVVVCDWFVQVYDLVLWKFVLATHSPYLKDLFTLFWQPKSPTTFVSWARLQWKFAGKHNPSDPWQKTTATNPWSQGNESTTK